MRLLVNFILYSIISLCFLSSQESISISSANQSLVNEFNSAKELAYYYVVTGEDPDYIPAYWGSYPIRECFCSRDICHQAESGHLLGLDLENFSMLKTFASDAPASNEYWPKWSYDFYGNPYFVDADFKELPAPFDIVEKIYEQYLWTGNPEWIWDETLFTFCQNTVTHFVNIHDQNNNGIVELHTDLATYWEQESDDFIEAGDSFSGQYQAVLAFAGILQARGNQTEADSFFELAEELQNKHATDWFDEDEDIYIRGFDADGNYKTDFGHENSFFMPMKRITDFGPRTKKYVEFSHKSIAYPNGSNFSQWSFNTGINIEAKTYLPQMAYYNNRIAIGWHWLKNIMDSNSDYPEVPFMIVGNIVAGMMGLSPNAPNHKITTLSKLNYEVPWIQADNVPLGENQFSIKHEGQTKSTLTNTSGPTMTWEAQFYGEFNEAILVDETPILGSIKSVNGANVTYIEINVSPGQSITIELPEQPINGELFLSDLDWVSANSSNGDVKRDVMSQGYAMALDGIMYEKGVGVHGNSEITYNLDSQFFRFSSDYGIDDSKTLGSAIFVIIADGHEVFNSGMIHSSNELKTVDINVTGVNQLILKTIQSNNWDAMCNWGNARLNTEESPILSIEYSQIENDNDGNGEFDPGETATVMLNIANLGITSNPTSVTCLIESDYSDLISVNTSDINVGVLDSYFNDQISFEISINNSMPRGANFTLNFEINDGVNFAEDSQIFFIPAPEFLIDYSNITFDSNNNGIPEPGETFELHFEVQNIGNYPSEVISINAQSTGQNQNFLVINTDDFELSELNANNMHDFYINCSINSNTPRETTIEITINLSDGEFNASYNQSFTMPYPQIKMEYLGFNNDSNGNGILEKGETAKITIQIKNNGTGPTNQTNLFCQPLFEFSQYITVLNNNIDMGILNQNEIDSAIVEISINENAPENLIFNLDFIFSDDIDQIGIRKSIGIDVLWLSDAFWSYHQNGWGETGRDVTVQGLPITLNGIIYEKGLGLHAESETRMDLNGQFTRFISDIGVDDEISNGSGSVEFQIYADGVEEYNSGLMNADSPTQTIDIDVTEVNEFILIIDESTFGISSDHADWAGAYFTATCLLGDLNSDTQLNILDVIRMVQCVLEIQNCDCADMNQDDIINIMDIVSLVGIILNP